MSMRSDAPIPFRRAGSQPTDALADLFLGDGPLAPARAFESSPPRPAEPVAPAPSVNLGPSAPFVEDTSIRQHDRHDDLGPLPEPRVEALILGHLPVLASAWVGQFTKLSADDAGCTALLRVRAGTTSIDLFNASAEPAPCASPEDAVRAANSQARRWLVQVDETDEPALAALPSITSLTLLCGSDDAAVVACYRTLKSLGTRDDTRDKIVRLAIMGAAGDKAKAAADKLAAASRTFLGREIELVPGAVRVTAWNSRTLFRGISPASLDSLVPLLECRGQPAPTGDAAPTPPEAPMTPDARARNVTRTDAYRAALHDVMSPAGQVGPLESRRPRRPLDPVLATQTTPDMAPESASDAAPTPTPVSIPDALRSDTPHAPVSPSFAAPSALVALIEGLSPISLACPVAPGVALARDAAGSLHLVASARAPGETGRAWCELDAALAWATLNAPLLAAAAALRVAAPTCHLLAGEPREARRLLDSGVRVYAMCANKDGTPIAGVPLN
ncbi:MAG: hypothetical protein JNL50_00090 [Phycisphaerae bacterium]|nr:hypothetical protein [Phycisphaerae bacterium]